jgi:predicted DNA-binding protein
MKTKATKKNAKANSSNDVINLILEDHKPLKKLIKILKGDSKLSVKKPAFEKFAPLLNSHAKPEEQTVYVAMKKRKDLRSEALEGDTEHMIADQLVDEIKCTKDKDMWMAKVKVLSELVEHHIEEEEDDLLPDYKKATDLEERIQIGEQYSSLRAEMLTHGSEDSPHEKNGAAGFSTKKIKDEQHAKHQATND